MNSAEQTAYIFASAIAAIRSRSVRAIITPAPTRPQSWTATIITGLKQERGSLRHRVEKLRGQRDKAEDKLLDVSAIVDAAREVIRLPCINTRIRLREALAAPVGKFGYDCTNCPANTLATCEHDDCQIKQSSTDRQQAPSAPVEDEARNGDGDTL